ncbi:MAG TPA: hypothetical protein VFT64_01115 [Rickettsiales bacterium]|nr:hypothetical protein [Rickettsiales bacterium]
MTTEDRQSEEFRIQTVLNDLTHFLPPADHEQQREFAATLTPELNDEIVERFPMLQGETNVQKVSTATGQWKVVLASSGGYLAETYFVTEDTAEEVREILKEIAGNEQQVNYSPENGHLQISLPDSPHAYRILGMHDLTDTLSQIAGGMQWKLDWRSEEDEGSRLSCCSEDFDTGKGVDGKTTCEREETILSKLGFNVTRHQQNFHDSMDEYTAEFTHAIEPVEYLNLSFHEKNIQVAHALREFSRLAERPKTKAALGGEVPYSALAEAVEYFAAQLSAPGRERSFAQAREEITTDPEKLLMAVRAYNNRDQGRQL